MNVVLLWLHAAGGTANPVNVSYVAPGCDQPYAFTFRADIFHSGKISSVKATSDKDDVVVKPSENECQAQVSDSYRVIVWPRWLTVFIQLDVIVIMYSVVAIIFPISYRKSRPDLTKDNIMMTLSDLWSSFQVTAYVMYKVNYNSRTLYVRNYSCCCIQLEISWYNAGCDVLGIATFLVKILLLLDSAVNLQ